MSETGGAQDLWTDDTLHSLIADLVARRPDAPAIIGETETLSFAALDDRVKRVAGGLAALGIGKGDVVSIQLPNLPEYLITYLAVTSLGGVLSTIHMPYGPREAEDLMRHAGSRAVVCLGAMKDRSPAGSFLAVKQDLPSLDHVIAVGDAPDGAVPFAQVASADPATVTLPRATDPYLMLFTSGTSASPKGIKVDYRRFLANARVNFREKALGEDSIMMSAPPFSHLLGLYTFHLTLYAGCANLLLPAFSPPAFVETIARGRPTHVFTAPAHVAACEQAGLLDPEQLSSIEFAIISGAMAAPEIYEGFQKYLRGGKVGQLWGMTECQCGMFTRPGDGIDRASTFCGRTSEGNEARIADLDGTALPPGEEGELQIRGCSVFDGYHENPEANAASFTDDGWFRTGDLATMDEAGFVAITGRDKDIINRGGVKINPVDVEATIDRHPAIIQSAIVPMTDPVLGERACCFAVLAPGQSLTLDDVTAWLDEHGIAKLKWPERLEVIDEMPLTPTRKIIKGRLSVPE